MAGKEDVSISSGGGFRSSLIRKVSLWAHVLQNSKATIYILYKMWVHYLHKLSTASWALLWDVLLSTEPAPSLFLKPNIKSSCVPINRLTQESVREVPSVSGPAAVRQHEDESHKESSCQQSLQQSATVFRNGHLGQVIGDLWDLVSDAHKDEGADDDVEGGDSGNKDQDALGVSCQPDVVLTDEELQE